MMVQKRIVMTEMQTLQPTDCDTVLDTWICNVELYLWNEGVTDVKSPFTIFSLFEMVKFMLFVKT